MPCRFPGPHPGGKFRGIWPEGSPDPHPRGELKGFCSRGSACFRGEGGGDPPGWLLLRVVRILLECILVTSNV